MPGFQELGRAVIENIEKVVIGKRPQITTVLAAMLADGHVLLEDVPGVAKTMLARALAVSMGCRFKRVQCTPDLLPTDVTGVSVFNQQTRQFEFVEGPVFTNVLLADEINRATPRAQSALLEAMEERQSSADGVTKELPRPFFLIATQNPIEQEGTFPLPEAQLDRFLVRISMGYPDMDQEADMLARLEQRHPIETLKPVVNAEAVRRMQQFIRRVFVHREVRNYILRIVHATRRSLKLALPASPRGSIALYRTAQALAALESRDYVLPDDIKRIAEPVLAHRLIVKPEFRLRKETAASIVAEVLREVAAPAAVKFGRDGEGEAPATPPPATSPGQSAPSPAPPLGGGRPEKDKDDGEDDDMPKLELIDL